MLVCTQGRVLIQKRDPDDAILEEWFLPFHCCEELETALELSEKFLYFIRKDYFVIIYKNCFETQNVVVHFEPAEFAVWDTFTGNPTCITRVPLELPVFTGGTLELEAEQKLVVRDENISYFFEIIKSFTKGSVSLVTYYFSKIFEEHKGKVCKLFIQKDNPLCLEFSDGHRIFLAPIV